jgi:hypothetical protein
VLPVTRLPQKDLTLLTQLPAINLNLTTDFTNSDGIRKQSEHEYFWPLVVLGIVTGILIITGVVIAIHCGMKMRRAERDKDRYAQETNPSANGTTSVKEQLLHAQPGQDQGPLHH